MHVIGNVFLFCFSPPCYQFIWIVLFWMPQRLFRNFGHELTYFILSSTNKNPKMGYAEKGVISKLRNILLCILFKTERKVTYLIKNEHNTFVYYLQQFRHNTISVIEDNTFNNLPSLRYLWVSFSKSRRRDESVSYISMAK
jgi:hypothetical protein